MSGHGRRKHAQQRRLACPVRPDDADRFIRAQRKIDRFQDHERIEALVDPEVDRTIASACPVTACLLAARSLLVVGDELGLDRHVGIGRMLGDHEVELETSSRPSPSPIARR